MVQIKGIQITTVSIAKPNDDGNRAVSGTYHLVSNTDKVLASQDFNTYNGKPLGLSPTSCALRDKLLASIQNDVEIELGLREAPPLVAPSKATVAA